MESDKIVKQETVSDYSSIERKKWVLDQYLAGRYPYLVREEYKELYKLSDASYDKDVLWTNTQLAKRGERDIDVIIDKHTDFYYDNYRLAREKGDIRSANQSLKQIEDLYKIHVSKSGNGMNVQVNHNTNNINLPTLSVDEIRLLLSGADGAKSIEI